MRETEAVEKIREIIRDYGEDPETSHPKADQVLIEFLRDRGFSELADEWEKVPRWYS